MKSKKIGSPLKSIFQQWVAMQKQEQQQASAYNILLQTSYSLQDRITAAEPVENPHVYKRAAQLTPTEQATRDILGGVAWLEKLMEIAAQAVSDDNGQPQILYIVTQPSGVDIREMLSPDLQQSRIQVLDLATSNPWGWDGNEDDNSEEALACNLTDLVSIHRKLQKLQDKPTILIWQSLMPLLEYHGMSKMQQFLQALAPSLQVWPVERQGLTPQQHEQLEDTANALLSLQGGTMTMIREGVRERGNILREVLPFQLVQESVPGGKETTKRYRVVEGHGEVGTEDVADNSTNVSTNKKSEVNGKGSGKLQQNTKTRIKLQIEDESAGPAPSNSRAKSSGPKIYFDDDDPEFDDLDEEDPDDDLEI